ncbi:MAG TPA: alpha/beta hydrolase [Candidatus Dormibacteraeota bacterium]|nr:alpha/beta hydrolase [Candidatus Dormibacteraeota bacterium]
MATLAADAVASAGGFVSSADGTKIAYRAWPVGGASINFAVVHGLGEHAGRYERFARGMAEHGFGTFAVDLRGHGNSPGQRGHVDSWLQWTEDVAAFVDHVGAVAGGEVLPLGHSFGGAATLSTVLAGKLPSTQRFIVSSPALKVKVAVPAWKIRLGTTASKVLPKLALDNEVDPKLLSRIPEVVEEYRSDPLVHSKISSRLYTEWLAATRDIVARAGEIKIPFLILAGTDDGLIDPEGSKQLHEEAPAMSELRLLDGRYHEPFNDRDNEEVFTLIANWLAKR